MISVVIAVAIAAVVVALVIFFVSVRRSRSARTDWLGELSEIRRSSLGDDEEVTGVLSVIEVDDEEDPGGQDADRAGFGPGNEPPEADRPPREAPETERSSGDPEMPGAPSPGGSSEGDTPGEAVGADGMPALKEVSGSPDRRVSEGGTAFEEFDRPGDGVLRVESTGAEGLRVFVAEGPGTSRCAANLPHGALWFRPGVVPRGDSCTVRTDVGWIEMIGTGFVLVESDWCYVMCLDGATGVHGNEERGLVSLEAGQVGRFSRGSADPQIATVGVNALESESVVRRQRSLDTTAAEAKGPAH